jgi:3-oxoacyl-[acyl-carrier protein] reductase
MNALHNRVALVTGNSRGIGAGIAELFAAEGARVVLHGRDADALESVRAKIAAAGGEVLVLTRLIESRTVPVIAQRWYRSRR